MEVVRRRLDPAAPSEGARAMAASHARPDSQQTRFGRAHVVPADPVAESPRRSAEIAYRVFERLIALIGLIAGAPLILIAAILIRLDSPGPAVFRHKRPARSVRVRGRDLEGRTDFIPPPEGYRRDAQYYVPSYFTLIKLRTMYVDARAQFPSYYAYKFTRENFHSQLPTIRDDPRVTRAGRLLRRLSIDELPNFWSVLKGDMTLVGPRPEAPEVLQYYTPEEMVKFTVRPGITGLAQISGRGLLNWGETIALDLEYVRTRSVSLDLKIILLTIKRVLTRHGAF
jgi:lipopolysaccharide/colanic/teichoic acid biosynthesis glycosyltransferase